MTVAAAFFRPGDGTFARFGGVSLFVPTDTPAARELVASLRDVARPGIAPDAVVRELALVVLRHGFDETPPFACVVVADDFVHVVVLGEVSVDVRTTLTDEVIDGSSAITWTDRRVPGALVTATVGEALDASTGWFVNEGVVPAAGVAVRADKAPASAPAVIDLTEVAPSAPEPQVAEAADASAAAPSSSGPEPGAASSSVPSSAPAAPSAADAGPGGAGVATAVAAPPAPVGSAPSAAPSARATELAGHAERERAVSAAGARLASALDALAPPQASAAPTLAAPTLPAPPAPAPTPAAPTLPAPLDLTPPSQRLAPPRPASTSAPAGTSTTAGASVTVVAHDAATPQARTVAGVRCAAGHLNRPAAGSCARCRAAIDQATGTVFGARPSLGTLRFGDGTVVELTQGVLVGRSPARDATVGGEPARPVEVRGAGRVDAEHFEVQLDGWDVFVVDRSDGGTFLDDGGRRTRAVPYARQRVTPGNVITFGDTTATLGAPTA